MKTNLICYGEDKKIKLETICRDENHDIYHVCLIIKLVIKCLGDNLICFELDYLSKAFFIWNDFIKKIYLA